MVCFVIFVTFLNFPVLEKGLYSIPVFFMAVLMS